MTDHYFELEELDRFGTAIGQGSEPFLSPATRRWLVAALRKSRRQGIPVPFYKRVDSVPSAAAQEGEQRKKPWWRFW
jgi:hypothetical protein